MPNGLPDTANGHQRFLGVASGKQPRRFADTRHRGKARHCRGSELHDLCAGLAVPEAEAAAFNFHVLPTQVERPALPHARQEHEAERRDGHRIGRSRSIPPFVGVLLGRTVLPRLRAARRSGKSLLGDSGSRPTRADRAKRADPRASTRLACVGVASASMRDRHRVTASATVGVSSFARADGSSPRATAERTWRACTRASAGVSTPCVPTVCRRARLPRPPSRYCATKTYRRDGHT